MQQRLRTAVTDPWPKPQVPRLSEARGSKQFRDHGSSNKDGNSLGDDPSDSGNTVAEVSVLVVPAQRCRLLSSFN